MERSESHDLRSPRRLSSAAVFSSPHSGRNYPEAFVTRSQLDPLALRASEDAFVDQLFDCAPEFGAPIISARAPRAYLDLNRGPDELDPAVVAGARSAGVNPRVTAGLGVIPRVVGEGRPIYAGKIPLAEAQERIAAHHTPYHDNLAALMREARRQFGEAVLFDCHSMPSDAQRVAARIGGRWPEIVLGDRFGSAAERMIVDSAQAAFEAEGFVVARNAPFAGGYITQRYGKPSHGWHAIQIEIDRSLYLNEKMIRPSNDFDMIRAALKNVVRMLCQLPRPAAGALAAE